jgi:hypothetical protein
MPRYMVTLEEVVRYSVEVEAENADEAMVVAPEVWAASEEPDRDFEVFSQGVEPMSVIDLST